MSDDGWEPGPTLDDDDDLEGSADGASAEPEGESKGEKDKPKPAYPDLDTWMRKHLSPMIRRRFGGTLTWCSEWYRHAEAVSRLNALWQEWEKARVEGTMSNWWLYHADPHLAALMNKDSGPFMTCKPGDHRAVEPLPMAENDPALWLSSAFSDPLDPSAQTEPDGQSEPAVTELPEPAGSPAG